MPDVDPATWAHLDAQDGLPEAVWFLPRTDRREFACLLVERVGGPKAYQRHWENGECDWGWVPPDEDAVLLWLRAPTLPAEDAANDDQSPYETGVCPGCGRPVEFEQVDVSQPGGTRETVRGHWVCWTPGCRFVERGA